MIAAGRIAIWLTLTLTFWTGTLLVQPIKKTSIGTEVIVGLNEIDLLAITIKEEGFSRAIRDIRRRYG